MPIYKDKGKKDGLQKYRVRVNYTDSYGKAKQLTRIAYGLEEAKAIESRLMRQQQQGETAPGMTIAELYEEYTAAKRLDVRETTLDKTMQILSIHVLPTFSSAKLTKLTPQMLQKWKEEIAAKNLAIITRQNIFGEFRAMLNYAVRMEFISKNPIIAVGNFRDSHSEPQKEKLHYYTVPQFQQFIEQARKDAEKTKNYGFYVFFAIAFYTGMRKGEINALKWSDIEGNIIHILRSMSQKTKESPKKEGSPKNTSSIRDIQMPIPLIEILKEHKNRQQKGTRFSEEYYVCGGAKWLSDSTISKKGFRYAERAELPHIRVHDFRHSHASLLANEGINIQEIARRLGHSKIEETWNTYSHLYPREEERALNILNRIPVHDSYTKNLKTEQMQVEANETT